MNSELPLRDIHLPEQISWWPPALGWWLLPILLLLVIYLSFKAIKFFNRKTAFKSAKKILLQVKHDNELNDYDKLCQLSIWLRRVAVSIAPRSEVAGLTGLKWLEYLDHNMTGKPFSEGVGRIFTEAPYQDNKKIQVDLSELFDLCETWLKRQAKTKQ